MFNTDSVNHITFNLLEGQVDLILKSLELYAFNLHNVFAVDKDSDLEDLRNTMLYHTYNQILSCYNSNKYRIGYNVSTECKRQVEHKKKVKYYAVKKNIA